MITLLLAVTLPVINAENMVEHYRGSEHGLAEIKNGVLVVREIAHDLQLFFSLPRFMTSAADEFYFKYRGTKTSGRGGELFYSDGSHAWRESSMWRIPALINDGKWHEIVMPQSTIVNLADWTAHSSASEIRFDVLNAPGGQLEISEFGFRNSKEMKVAQVSVKVDREFEKKYDAPKWPDVKSEVWITNALSIPPPSLKVVQVKCNGGTIEPFIAKAGSTVTCRFDYEGELPQLPQKVTISLFDGNTPAWSDDIFIDMRNLERYSSKDWRIKIDYQLPLYFTTRHFTATLTSPFIRVVSGEIPEAEFDLVTADKIDGFEVPPVSGVAEVAGAPQFTLNGKPFYALWGTVHANARADKSKRHSGAPLRIATVWNAHLKWWPKGEEFNSLELERCAEAYRRSYPADCYFMWDISIYPPPDWRDNNPDEMTRDDKGNINNDCGDNEINYSFASRKARKDMMKMMEKAIRYLESSPFANRIIGYRVNSGHTVEWLGWDATAKGAELDFSPVAQREFKIWAKEHYPQLTDWSVPTKEERFDIDGLRILWDQPKHLKTVAYYDFYSHQVADFSIMMCKRAKELVGGKKLVGTYQGYMMTLFDGGNAMRSHYATEKIVKSGAFDFLMSPQPYSGREIGDTCGDMKPFRTMQMRGIVSVKEDDTRTAHMGMARHSQVKTLQQSVNIMRRNMGISLCRREPFYTYAISGGTDFDFPQFTKDTIELRKAGERMVANKVERHAEIAIVVSEESIKSMPRYDGRIRSDRYYTQGWQWYGPDGKAQFAAPLGGRPIITESHAFAMRNFPRIGAPVDFILAEDLENAPKDYKLYFFVNCSKATKGFKKAVEELRNMKTMLVWSYAPGYLANEGNSVENMKALTGITFEELTNAIDLGSVFKDGTKCGSTEAKRAPAFSPIDADVVVGHYIDAPDKASFAFKKTGNAISCFSGSYRIELPVMHKLAKRAGVHLYVDTLDPVEANDAFFTLHARFAGEKNVKLPRKVKEVYDVFNRKVIARDTDNFTFDAPLHSSWLFEFR